MRIQRVAEGGASARGASRRRTRERESASTVRDTSQHKTFPPGLPATPSGYLRRLLACNTPPSVCAQRPALTRTTPTAHPHSPSSPTPVAVSPPPASAPSSTFISHPDAQPSGLSRARAVLYVISRAGTHARKYGRRACADPQVRARAARAARARCPACTHVTHLLAVLLWPGPDPHAPPASRLPSRIGRGLFDGSPAASLPSRRTTMSGPREPDNARSCAKRRSVARSRIRDAASRRWTRRRGSKATARFGTYSAPLRIV